MNETTFKSLAGTPYASFVNRNGEQRPRAYGGHVYAQAAYAASKTVPGDFIIHVCKVVSMKSCEDLMIANVDRA